jgi:hypothetical protein
MGDSHRRKRESIRTKAADNLMTPTVCLLVMLVVFTTILSIEPDHHSPPCGGSNIVVAVTGPRGA